MRQPQLTHLRMWCEKFAVVVFFNFSLSTYSVYLFFCFKVFSRAAIDSIVRPRCRRRRHRCRRRLLLLLSAACLRAHAGRSVGWKSSCLRFFLLEARNNTPTTTWSRRQARRTPWMVKMEKTPQQMTRKGKKRSSISSVLCCLSLIHYSFLRFVVTLFLFLFSFVLFFFFIWVTVFFSWVSYGDDHKKPYNMYRISISDMA